MTIDNVKMEKIMSIEEVYRHNNNIDVIFYRESAHIITACMALGGDNIQRVLNDYSKFIADEDEKERMVELLKTGDGFA